MKNSLEKLPLKKRILSGYQKVIRIMICSGVISLVVIFLLLGNMLRYVQNVQRADTAVKICRLDINAAARNIREMALNKDSSTYDQYEKEVESQLNEVDSEIKSLKQTGIVDDNLCEQYSQALQDWGTIGYSIMEDIKNEDIAKATDKILTQCTPALNNVVDIGTQLDEVTDEASHQAVTVVIVVIGIVVVILFIIISILYSNKLSEKITTSILNPLRDIEDVAKQLTLGNLHSELKYHSEDEIGKLAHDLRKSIKILSSYVDDIGYAMKEFADGNFDVQPEVEWKGDFINILDSFMMFEKSMAKTVKGIQSAADEVSGGAEQVSVSSNSLAEGATEQAAVIEELTASISVLQTRFL